jgi:hypothetical protein
LFCHLILVWHGFDESEGVAFKGDVPNPSIAVNNRGGGQKGIIHWVIGEVPSTFKIAS